MILPQGHSYNSKGQYLVGVFSLLNLNSLNLLLITVLFSVKDPSFNLNFE